MEFSSPNNSDVSQTLNFVGEMRKCKIEFRKFYTNSVRDRQAVVRKQDRTLQHQYIFAASSQSVFILSERFETTEAK